MELSNQKLMKITGGGYGIWAFIGGALAFIISAVEGFINPTKCRS